MGDSRTDGPDVVIPRNSNESVLDNLCSVAHVADIPDIYHGASLGIVAWSGDVEEVGVRTGDVILLRGTLNNYAARILMAEYSADDEQSYILFSPYGYATADEDDVPFEVHAAHVATVRLYFEHPVAALIGYWYPGTMTLFSNGNYTYSPHTDYREDIDVGVEYTELVIDVSGGSTNKIDTLSADIDFEVLGVKPGDSVNLKYSAVISLPIPADVEVAGKSLVLTLSGTSKTYFFSGTDPIPLDDEDGVSGQIEAAFGITVEVRDAPVDGYYRLYLVSTQKIVVSGGTALGDLGLLSGATNDTLSEAVKGTHTVIAVDVSSLYVETVFSEGITGDAAAIADLTRVGVVTRTKSQMEGSQEFGYYYMDVEVQSMQDSSGALLEDNTYLSISGYRYTEGFCIETAREYSFGTGEEPMLRVTPVVYASSGDPVAVADYGYDVHYFQAPTVESVQAVLSSDDVRATADNMMAKQKPLLEIGVGPLVYSGDTEAILQSVIDRVKGRVLELVAEGSPVTLASILAVVTPLGVSYDASATLFWRYEDLGRARHLRFGDSVVIDKMWVTDVPSSMIVFEG
jgi:hypothetical protein